MFLARNLLAAALLIMCATAAHAQTGCVPNPNDNGPLFTDGCRISAVGLNKLVGLGTLNIVGYTSTATCDGATDVTATLQADLNAASAKGGGLYYLPKAKGCVISSANLNVPFNMQIKCADLSGGYWTAGNYTANADIFVSPSVTIKFGAVQLGGRSGISGCLILRQGYTNVSTLRQAITAVAAFAGTAITCAGATDVNVDDNLIIGFNTGILTNCDRLHFVDNHGDNTNFFFLTQCNDTCTLHDDLAWPFVTNPYQGFPGTQVTNVTGATISGGGTTLTLTFAAPATPIVNGDTVVLAQIGGITGAQFGRFTVTSAGTTQLSVSGTFSGAFTSGGTIYLSGLRRTGVGFYFGAMAGGGPTASRLVTFGYDIGIHYAGGSVANCTECWIDSDSQVADLDPTVIGLLLDGSSGLNNTYQGFINALGTAIYKSDVSILTVGPGSQIDSFNTAVGTYVINLQGGFIQFDNMEAYTSIGVSPFGQVLFVATAATGLNVSGSTLNGTTTFQNATASCPKFHLNGAIGPCTYTPSYTGVSISGTPLESVYWTDATGKTTVYYSDSGHTVSGATSTQFSISLPVAATLGGICQIGTSSIVLPASTSYPYAQITGSVANWNSLGTSLTSAIPGTSINTPDVLSMLCTYE